MLYSARSRSALLVRHSATQYVPKTKVCTKCQKRKYLDRFSIHKKCRYGRNSVCLLCAKAYETKRREESRERVNARTRELYAKKVASNPGWRHGLTADQYHAMVAKGCYICGTTEHTLHIDHDHSCCPRSKNGTCGKCVRGVLCIACNTGLGKFRDSVDRLQSAINYLQGTK